jgi:hypothetical protein
VDLRLTDFDLRHLVCLMVLGFFTEPFSKLEDVGVRCTSDDRDAAPPLNGPEFDYIIVGGTSIAVAHL